MRRFLGVSLLAFLLATSCADPAPKQAGVMLAMMTDMEVPDTIRVVGLYIDQVDGDVQNRLVSLEVGSSKSASGDGYVVTFPANFMIQSNDSPSARVRVRLVGYGNDRTALVMREARTVVPSERIALLRMPLLWLNGDDVVDAEPDGEGPADNCGAAAAATCGGDGRVDAFRRLRSFTCQVDETLGDEGRCQSIEIDTAQLADWVPPAPRDDGSDRGPAVGGEDFGTDQCSEPSCFDVATCFATEDEYGDDNFAAFGGEVEAFEKPGVDAGCGVPLGRRGAALLAAFGDLSTVRERLAGRFNVAVETRSEGVCVTDGGGAKHCYVTLDLASTKLSLDTNEDGKAWVVLPPGVCRRWQRDRQKDLASRQLQRVLVSPRCLTKPEGLPFCGVASFGSSSNDRGCADGRGWDGSARQRPTPDAGTDARVDDDAGPSPDGDIAEDGATPSDSGSSDAMAPDTGTSSGNVPDGGPIPVDASLDPVLL